MNTEAISKTIELVKQFEGCRLKAYRDSVGVLTIGYGFTGPTITSHTEWTQAEADKALMDRVTIAVHQAAVASPNLVNFPSKHAAIADFIYNLGYGTYINHSLVQIVNIGNWESAALHIKLYDHAGGKVLAGLTRRRELEASLLLQ